MRYILDIDRNEMFAGKIAIICNGNWKISRVLSWFERILGKDNEYFTIKWTETNRKLNNWIIYYAKNDSSINICSQENFKANDIAVINFDDIYEGLGSNTLNSDNYTINISIDTLKNAFIHCDKEWKANILLDYLRKNGIEWHRELIDWNLLNYTFAYESNSCTDLFNNNYWDVYFENTLYMLNNSSLDYCKLCDSNETIIEFDDIFLKNNKENITYSYKFMAFLDTEFNNYYLKIKNAIHEILIESTSLHKELTNNPIINEIEDKYSSVSKDEQCLILKKMESIIDDRYNELLREKNSIYDPLEKFNYTLYDQIRNYYINICKDIIKFIEPPFQRNIDPTTIEYISNLGKEYATFIFGSIVKNNFWTLDIFPLKMYYEYEFEENCHGFQLHYKNEIGSPHGSYENYFWGCLLNNIYNICSECHNFFAPGELNSCPECHLDLCKDCYEKHVKKCFTYDPSDYYE